MDIGEYKVTAIETGQFALDGGAMFGVVPRTMWEKKVVPDDRNRIPMALRVMLIQGHGRNILVDTGIGEKWSTRETAIYAIDFEKNSLKFGLLKSGLRVEDITDVILTHLHFDHAGGATKVSNLGVLEPTFPNAKYYVQAQNLQWAKRPVEKDRASYLPHDFEPLLAHGVLETIDGPGELFPGIGVRLSQGHTAGLQIPVISDGVTTLVYPADLIPTRAHVPVPWVMAYDLRPVVSVAEKKALYARAVPNRWILFYEHDAVVAASYVVSGERGFEAGETVDVSVP
ncbi:MAG: MBL fold metallo-hydrolase [Myxococcales bacterium]|nr:MBL fold metallo-hydrolase [Myxococcales bacterium]